MTEQEQIQEINRHIRDGINYWADIMLTSEADRWAFHLDYFPRDIANAAIIFNHVLGIVGIKQGIIDEKNVEEFGKRIRQLVIDMTGYDPKDIVMNIGNEK